MTELLRTNDIVVLTYAECLLRDAGIECAVLDENMSVMEGSLGILPRRILVDTESHDRARRILTEAGLGGSL